MGGVSGTWLTAFGLVFSSFLYRSGIDRTDREIRTLAKSSLSGARPAQYGQKYEQSLKVIYGEDPSARIARRVRDAQECRKPRTLIESRSLSVV